MSQGVLGHGSRESSLRGFPRVESRRPWTGMFLDKGVEGSETQPRDFLGCRLEGSRILPRDVLGVGSKVRRYDLGDLLVMGQDSKV